MAISRAPPSMPAWIMAERKVGQRAEAEDVGLDGLAQARAHRCPWPDAQLGRRRIQPRPGRCRRCPPLQSGRWPGKPGMVHAALAHAHDHNPIPFTHAPPVLSHSRTFGDGVVHFLGGQLGEHRQRDAGRPRCVPSSATGPTIARLFAPRIAFLLVDGDGVVALGIDAVLVQEIQQRVAMLGPLGLDDIEVKHVTVAGHLVGQGEIAGIFQAGRCSAPPTCAAARSSRRCASAWR